MIITVFIVIGYLTDCCLLREDVVRVHDGTGPLSPVIKFLCNQGANTEVISTKESLFIEFTSTSIWPGHGFKAVYHFVHKADLRQQFDQRFQDFKSILIVAQFVNSPIVEIDAEDFSACVVKHLGGDQAAVEMEFVDFQKLSVSKNPFYHCKYLASSPPKKNIQL
uniref:CUB domain-containing protein n=1 Tax=Rhodnius prolixus TaxID=13249 RepID=T1I827_RHOPR